MFAQIRTYTINKGMMYSWLKKSCKAPNNSQ
jgi:hypothetical protein